MLDFKHATRTVLTPTSTPCALSVRTFYNSLRQTLRGALAGIDKHRQSLISQHLHHEAGTENACNGSGDPECSQNQARVRLALGRASVTASFHSHQGSPASSSCGGDAGSTELGQGEVVADMGFHELAALQLVRKGWFLATWWQGYEESRMLALAEKFDLVRQSHGSMLPR